MVKKRLAALGLVFALLATSVFGHLHTPDVVYAEEVMEETQARTVAMGDLEFLSLCDPQDLINVTTSGTQAEEMMAVINEVTQGLEGDYDRAVAIYDWVAENVEYESDPNVNISAAPYDVFTSRYAVCGGFSNLLKEMLNLAGIPAAAVVGYYTSFPHQWNAVYVDGEWVYADATAQGYFNEASMPTTHRGNEVKDVTWSYGDLQLGYYHGLAVTAASGSVVEIPDSYMEYPITSFSYSLFNAASNLEEIKINANITQMEESTLKSYTKMKGITVAEGNPAYASHEGALFTADYQQLIVYPYSREATEFTLPKETSSFDYKEAFRAENLQNLYVEEGSSYFSSYDGAIYDSEKTMLLSIPKGKTSLQVYGNAAITDDAFANVDKSNFTIIGQSGSPAETYAKENQIAFQAEDVIEEEYTLVTVVNPVANSWNTGTTYPNDGGPAFAFNDNTGNWWHTNYGTAEDGNKNVGSFTNAQVSEIPAFSEISENRVWIGGEFEKAVYLGKFTYRSRSDSSDGNNRMQQWALYTANVTTGEPTDADFTVAASGTFGEESSNGVEAVLTTPVKATHFRLVAFQFNGQVTATKIEMFAAPEPKDPRMVACYSFDKITGTTVKDECGNRNGQLLGSTAKGKVGNALSVTEALQGMNVSGTNTYTEDWTVAYWVKATTDFDKEISVLEDAAKKYSFSLRLGTANNRNGYGFRVGDNDGDVLTFGNYGDLAKDTWYHMTWAKDNDAKTFYLYVNGKLVKSNTWSGMPAGIPAPYDVIGGTGFTGLIDEVKVYNAVLTQEEIAKVMIEDCAVEETTIYHTETSREDGNYFAFSESGWSAMGSSTEHVWSDNPTSGNESSIWYEVHFVGHKIDIYAGKNHPHGRVKYYIDGVEKGVFDLYNGTNINSAYITTLEGMSDGPHVLKAVAMDAGKCIDCAKVVVYHIPYDVTGVTIAEPTVSMVEGSTKQVSYTVAPDYAYLKDITYTSADPSIATVSKDGVITAVMEGTTTISMAASNMTGTKEIAVTVIAGVPQIAGSIVDTDTQWTQDRYNEVKGLTTNSSTVTAWKNDKAISEIALVSVDCALKNVTVTASDLINGENTIDKSNVTTTFVKSTKAYNGGYLGYGDPNRALPEDNGTNRSESSDILYQTTPINIPYNSVQPVWVEIAIPKTAAAGTYTGTISVTAKGIADPLTFTYEVIVQDATLPDATEFKNGFDIELWQYPYSSAEYYDVEPFSEEHFEIMRSSMEIYKEIGGHAITTSIVEEAWSGQTYSENAVHYPSMVKWNKQADGSFTWDYTDFDKWVTFCRDEMGLGDKIVLYSIAPWNNSIGYWQNGTLTYQRFSLSNESDQNIWKAFLSDLITHLMDKGWFDDAYMGIDERGFSKEAFDLIDSVVNVYVQPLKTAGAMDHFVDKWDLALRVTDLNVGDTAAAANPAKFKELVAARAAKGYRTTLYSCTEHQPGNFSLSAPVESYWGILNAGMMGTAGFLRWAYDAWVEDPLRDATHNAFEPGDCFLIYPDEKDATDPTSKSSVRLERMAEGVRDVNKLMQIRQEVPALSDEVDAVFAKIKYGLVTSRSYLNANGVAQLRNETAEFKQALNALTNEYIDLKENGTNEVTSITIAQGATAELTLGDTLQLTANLAPSNLKDDTISWKSSNDKIATVDANGQVLAIAEGTVTITVTAEVDKTKTAQIVITVKGIEIDESKQVSYYSFDEITGTTVKDEWGNRDGQLLGATAKGKQGNALSVTEALNGVTVTGDNTTSGDWTIGYWVKATSDFNQEISVLEDAEKKYSLSLRLGSDSNRNGCGFRVGDGDGDVLTLADYGRLIKDTWYHMTWIKDEDAGISLYVNGERVGSNTWTNGKSIKAPYDVIGGTGFTGLIDEVKVYNAVLTQAEIVASMQVDGINIRAEKVELYIDDTYSLDASVVTDKEDKTITYSSSNEKVATVDADGVITPHKKGVAVITLSAAGYTATVEVTVLKELIISNELPVYKLYELEGNYLSDVDRPDTSTDEGRAHQYLGQPDMIRTRTGRLITAYPNGHGKGPIIMKISDDNGETWTTHTNTPASWEGSQETPTLYVLNMSNGKERLIMITACPGWGTDSAGNQYGWNTSYSDDNGETWTEYKHWYSQLEDGTNNASVVAMASLIQLKDENGNYIDEWMGVYHFQSPFKNYKTILSFDENGNEQWTEPEWYLAEHSSIESLYQMCEIGMFRSPDGKRIIGLARTQSHNNFATLIYSDDEGKTWSEPMNLPGSLAGERHKAVYDPISGRLVITFREIRYDLNGNNQFDGSGDWTCDDWGVWVGTYEDLINQEPGDYRIRIAEDWAQSAKSGDTGYAGLVVLEDGTLIMDSYGHWDKEYSTTQGFGVTADLCYIKQAKFKLADVENAYGLVNYDALAEAVAEVEDTDCDAYTETSWKTFADALEAAQAMLADRNVQQVEVDAMIEELENAVERLEKVSTDAVEANVAGYTLTLEGNIGVNFHMQLGAEVLADENAYMNFNVGGVNTQINVKDAAVKTVENITYYVFKCEVPVKDMETMITAQIILVDGRTSSEFKYTVQEYADKITGGEVTLPDAAPEVVEATKELVEAMSDFGDYASTYFAEETLEETAEMKAVTAETLEEFEGTFPEDSIYYGSSLLLKSNTILRHYFTEEVEGSTQKGSLYYIESEGIPAHELGKEIVTEVEDMQITYNPLSYAYIALSRDDVDENLKSVMRAMYLYYEAAQDYLEATN